MTLRGFFSHVGAEQRDVLDDGQTGLDEEAPHHIFVHAGRRAQHAGADVSDAGQLEESLNGAVFAEGAVQHGKDHIRGWPLCLGFGWEHRMNEARAQAAWECLRGGALLRAWPLGRRRAAAAPLRSRRR